MFHKSSASPRTQEVLGRGIELSAHGVSLSRVVGGFAIAQYISHTPNYQSWKLSAIYVGLALGDAIDGKLGRFGRRLQQKMESVRRPFNAYIDQLSDKAMNTSIMGAIALREQANGHKAYAGTIKAATAVDTARNICVTADRIVADTQNIDSRAQKGGKWKMFEQSVVVAAALSPVTKHALGRLVVGTAATHVSYESVKSGLELHNSFTEARAEMRMSEATVALLESPSFPAELPAEESPFLPPTASPHSLN